MASIFDRIDLPDRLDPMTVKELRQGLRKGSFLIPFISIHIFAIAALFSEFYMDEVVSYNRYTGVMQVFLFLEEGPFWWVAGMICMLGMPLGALMLMTPEMEEGNYELLQITPLSRWKIVIGKFVAMWAICLLTFSSLLPYMIVRYFVGGMDVWRNLSMAFTVVFVSAIICAGALAASSYKGAVQRVLVMTLFSASVVTSGFIALGICATRSGGCGFFYHINALGFILCYVALGLVMARSKIRLTVHHYEVKPSWMVIGLLIFTPMVVGMATLVSFGWLGGIGFVAMGIVSKYADVTPTSVDTKGLAVANIPLNPHHMPKPPSLVTTPVPVISGSEVDVPIVAKTDTLGAQPVSPQPLPKKPIKAYPKVDKTNYNGWK